MAAAAPDALAGFSEAPAPTATAEPAAGGEDSREVRVLQSLRGKICEAKNLLPYLGPNKMRDCFCTINLDQEEVYRTQVVEKSLSPFFSEEFYFEIPRTFQYLSFYVYDKNVLQRDLRIGKVAIKKEDLCNHSGKETWFSLQPVDSNSEVQGKVHLELKLNELITENGTVCQQLVVHVKACHGLPLINGQSCDPYATVSLVGPSRNDQKKTKVKKKTSNPQFNEIFYFEVTRSSSYTRKSQFQVEEEDIEKLEIRIDLWNNGNLVQDVFLGEIKVPVNVLRNDASHQAWYLLQPRDNGNKSSKTDDLGSLRLNICYTEDYVLPSEYYGPLKTLLLKSPDVQPISASAAYILGEICRDKNDAVLPLVRLLLHHDKLVPFATAVAELDLKETQDANTIFRGNSLATRCLDEMMKIVGGHYLKVTLKPILDEICESSKSCEIDPIKLKEGDNVENNKENLRYYVDKLFSTIVKSSMSCPTVMCDIFYSLRQMATQRFPNDPHVQYSAVSSFVFLRFFAVAVVSPHTFHLRPHHPDPQTIRTLTLISKTIQTLGSWGSLSKSKSSFKETFMCEFFKMFQEEGYITAVKKFLDEISSTETKESSGTSEPVHLKEGEMYKRAQGRTRIGKKNFKKRWFCLTSRELTYHKQPGSKDAIYTIPVKNILAVEKLEESSFNKKNMFQVIHTEKPLYVQANNCVEANEWIDVLCRVSRCNQNRLSSYHPSAYLNGSWLCCLETSENALGCKPCTAGVPADIQIDIDEDRETERIYSLFTLSLLKLQKMEEACGTIAVYQGPQKEPDDYSNFVIEDSVTTFKTIQQIKSVIEKLDEPHEKYRKKRSSSAKYGSKFTHEEIESILSGLENNQRLQSLSLRYCGLGPQNGSRLGSIVCHSAIRELHLGGNYLQCSGALGLLRPLAEYAEMQGKDQLATSSPDARNPPQLLQASQRGSSPLNQITESSRAVTVKPTSGKKRKKGIKKKIKDLIETGPWLVKLYLADNGIDGKGKEGENDLLEFTQILTCLIKYSAHLEEIDLGNNALGEKAAVDLLEALRVRKTGKLPVLKITVTPQISSDTFRSIWKNSKKSSITHKKKKKNCQSAHSNVVKTLFLGFHSADFIGKGVASKHRLNFLSPNFDCFQLVNESISLVPKIFYITFFKQMVVQTEF
ncbi:hypothetical protein MJT46_000226 [Ovis ammon polii x Ovis aries]|nr:hypothetical protein MJT46_000226 [Ovis ammon polii x Ovis aries]